MKKYLDILLFTLLFFFIFSYFTGKDTPSQLTWVRFETDSSGYKVPAGVALIVENNTAETMSLNTCENISLRFQWKTVELPETLCTQEELLSRESHTLDFSPHYSLFENPGDYTFELNIGEEKYIEQFGVQYRGAIWKIFTGLLYAPIYNLMAYLTQLFSNSLGWSIVVLTIIIRIVLLFPQHKMMVGQRKMQAIQPKIKKLQEKHKGNQQAMGMELMKLYKDEGVSPMGSCGFLLIQMPILIVIYNIILNITSEKNEFYLYDALQNFQTSQIDFNFFWLDLLGAGWVAGIILALVVALVQYIQIKLSLAWKANDDNKKGVVLEKKKWETDYNSMMPDPEMMNKFMLYGMPAMVAVFTYTLIAWVWLYWGISTLFAIFQQLFVNKIIKK